MAKKLIFRSHWMAIWPIARTGVMLIFRRKLFWILLALALINFLFTFATIYLKAELSAQNPAMARFADRILPSLDGRGDSYRDFMFAQGTVTMLLLAFAGAMLIGDDYRDGGIGYYLARRIGRTHYVLGKLSAIGMFVSLTTTIPALVLYIEYGMLTSSFTYYRENLGILFGILGYGLILAVVLSLLLFAVASWVQRTVPLVMVWAGIFVFLPAIGALMRRIYDDRSWMLLMMWRDVRVLGSRCFGPLERQSDIDLLPRAGIVVFCLCIVCIVALIPRVRAVRVVQ